MPKSLLYAFYLASSWLWCIGAFLPMLLLRDYGWISLAVFALSNVLGAAAFGWVMNQQRQQVFLASHSLMLKLFSRVTLAFQLFFVVWISALLGWWLLLVMLALVVMFYRADRLITWVATGVFLLSMLLAGQYLTSGPELPSGVLQPGWWHTLLPLALGFILSPYLDLTFHRAWQQSPNPRLSFGLGFGVFFLVLLVFVLFYSRDLARLVAGEPVSVGVVWPLVAFIILQTAFTTALHLKESQCLQAASWRVSLGLGGFYLLLLIGLLNFGVLVVVPWLDLPLTELIYKTFLLFYGLVVPLYLLLGKNRLYFWISLLFTVPIYSLGFLLGGDFLWLLTISLAGVVLMNYKQMHWLKRG
ncbi:hypothetical protein [Marinospirillum alkaliphilum]|uniref:Uncharacterized protein n=1 Tax=Marinospirillum alkaliphilum DSM 21637 TaxID=1122209 RepID=A0A1K2A1A6_9GAMM|nr:hypothetical protein [Marinospirillum alkaliphilum]SFX80120.1 hypothetical protein SAMN02745752_02928 [Marinospirillum alkaliphilum DSM 21637]